MYGYNNEETKPSGGGLKFGLNGGIAKMTKFEYITNAGKDGAPGEALDIEFTLKDGTTVKKYRKYPVTKAYKDSQEITDPNSDEIKAERAELSKTITQILMAYVPEDSVKAAFATPANSFQDYCRIATGLLPANFRDMVVDLFMEYQWKIADGQSRTFLQLPKTAKHGMFICAAKQPVGKWNEVRNLKEDGDLHYKDDAGNVHPFGRSAWFMSSNFASKQETNTAQAKANVEQQAQQQNAGTGGASGW